MSLPAFEDSNEQAGPSMESTEPRSVALPPNVMFEPNECEPFTLQSVPLQKQAFSKNSNDEISGEFILIK